MRTWAKAGLGFALLCVVACGSLEKTTYNGLVGLKAAYVTANQARTEFCAPKPDPKPKICADSKPVLQGAYDVLKNGTDLLAAYTAYKNKDVAYQLKLLIPKFAELGLELVTLESKFK